VAFATWGVLCRFAFVRVGDATFGKPTKTGCV